MLLPPALNHFQLKTSDFLSVLCMKEALAKYQEINNNLEFARELQKSFLALGQEVSPEL